MRLDDLRYEIKDRVEQIREFLDSPHGKIAGWSVLSLGMLVLLWSSVSFLRGNAAGVPSVECQFICAETGKTFTRAVRPGADFPVRSPFSGRDTGFPAELCYWAADGRIKSEPTAVLLNTYKEELEPTYCPDCGRLVTFRNRYPLAGQAPPPKKKESKKP